MLLWKRIRLEDFQFPTVTDYKKSYIKIDHQLPQGVTLDKSSKYTGEFNINENELKGTKGIGEKFTSFVLDSFNTGIYLNIPKNTKIKEPIKIEFKMDSKNPLVIDKNIIIAGPASEATIIFDYSTEDSVKGFHNGITKVIGEENSVINIIKIQRINESSLNFDTNSAFVKSHGQVNWISIELGSSISGSNFMSFLEEDSSESSLHSVYLGDGDRKLDLQYTMVHKGIRSLSNIQTRGVLMDKAKKVFRGNLDFRKGAKRANGVEEEYVVLLDPTVKSDSIPALLCEEDDVQGEHAASAGQIDKNKLFYLMSRGLSQREAKKLIVEANFRPIIDKIPYEDIRNTVKSEISRRLDNDRI